MPTKKPQNTVPPLVDQEMTDFVYEQERNVPHLYRDTKGNPTAGVGFHMPGADDAARYPFRLGTGQNQYEGRPATRDEIKDAYQKLSSRPYGQDYPAESFNPYSSKGQGLSKIGLPEEYSREQLRVKLQQAEQSLQSKIPDFGTLPRPARQALLDMEYNMGDARFRPHYKDTQSGEIKPGWPKLYQAIDARNWAEAARQSHSKDVPQDRNDWRRKKILAAGLDQGIDGRERQ